MEIQTTALTSVAAAYGLSKSLIFTSAKLKNTFASNYAGMSLQARARNYLFCRRSEWEPEY